MARLHDESNLRFAGLGVILGAFLFGAVIGSTLEVEICTQVPSVSRIGMTLGATFIVVLDLALRATHREAAKRLGTKRFTDPMSGARIGRIVPAWIVGLVLLAYCLQDGLRNGYC
jgi:hypothetical protein